MESEKLFYQDNTSNKHGFSKDFVIFFLYFSLYLKSLVHLPFNKLPELNALIFI